ncbi:MFS transporter [Dongshaea marina]|uniref:MFS transporter n=1 Tax=Dongshaea marina TaxID=2047966 RepID=UPI000D3E1A9F|nr:MFS transporter [Dongshaea marina]
MKTAFSARYFTIFVITSCFVLLQFALQTFPSIAVEPWRHTFEISLTNVTFLSDSFFLFYLICQIPAGALVDRYGAKRVSILTLLLAALLCFAFASQSSVWLAYGIRILQGGVCAGAIVCSFSVAKRYLPAHFFPIAVGITESIGMLGGFLCQSTLSRVVENHSWQLAMLLIGGLFLISSLSLALLYPGSSKITAPATPRVVCSQTSLRALLLNPTIWLYGCIGGMFFSIVLCFASLWCLPFLQQGLNLSYTQASLCSSMLFLGIILGNPLLGHWVSKRGCYHQAFYGCALLCLLLLITILFGKLSYFGLGSALFGIGFLSSAYVLPFPIISNSVPDELHAKAMSMANMIIILVGAALVEPAMNGIAYFSQNYQLILLPQLLAILAIPVTLWIYRYCTGPDTQASGSAAKNPLKG